MCGLKVLTTGNAKSGLVIMTILWFIVWYYLQHRGGSSFCFFFPGAAGMQANPTDWTGNDEGDAYYAPSAKFQGCECWKWPECVSNCTFSPILKAQMNTDYVLLSHLPLPFVLTFPYRNKHGGSRYGTSTADKRGTFLSSANFWIHTLNNRHIQLRLQKSSIFDRPGVYSTLHYQRNDKNQIYGFRSDQMDHCFYTGDVRLELEKAELNSYVAVDTCQGLRGLIYFENTTHDILPLQCARCPPDQLPHVMYPHRPRFIDRDVPLPVFWQTANIRSMWSRGPKKPTSQPHILRLSIILDHSLFRHFGQQIDRSVYYIGSLVNQATKSFQGVPLKLLIARTELWNVGDYVKLNASIKTTLNNLAIFAIRRLRAYPTISQTEDASNTNGNKHLTERDVDNDQRSPKLETGVWRQRRSRPTTMTTSGQYSTSTSVHSVVYEPHDLLVLLTARQFTNVVEYMSVPDSVCTPRAIAVIQVNTSETVYHWSRLLSLAIAESLGLKSFPCPPIYSCTSSDLFADGDKARIRLALLSGMADCLLPPSTSSTSTFNGESDKAHLVHSTQLKVQSDTCGNGKVDRGEECDPAGDSRQMPCCNPITCLGDVQSVCVHGPCCDRCRLRSRGQLCRDAQDECDLPEFCTGAEPTCPLDFYLEDGSPCRSATTTPKAIEQRDTKVNLTKSVDLDNALCYHGRCPTRTGQCKAIWGSGAEQAADYCFQSHNTKTEGACGLRGQNCQPEHAMCGLLHCKGGQPRPVSTEAQTGQPFLTYTEHAGKQFECKHLSHASAVRFVPEGTACDSNRYCFHNQCVPPHVAFRSRCPSGLTVQATDLSKGNHKKGRMDSMQNATCSANGLCVHSGFCLCRPGWTGPECGTPVAVNESLKPISGVPIEPDMSRLIWSYLEKMRRTKHGLSNTDPNRVGIHAIYMVGVIASVAGAIFLSFAIFFIVYRRRGHPGFPNKSSSRSRCLFMDRGFRRGLNNNSKRKNGSLEPFGSATGRGSDGLHLHQYSLSPRHERGGKGRSNRERRSSTDRLFGKRSERCGGHHSHDRSHTESSSDRHHDRRPGRHRRKHGKVKNGRRYAADYRFEEEDRCHSGGRKCSKTVEYAGSTGSRRSRTSAAKQLTTDELIIPSGNHSDTELACRQQQKSQHNTADENNFTVDRMIKFGSMPSYKDDKIKQLRRADDDSSNSHSSGSHPPLPTMQAQLPSSLTSTSMTQPMINVSLEYAAEGNDSSSPRADLSSSSTAALIPVGECNPNHQLIQTIFHGSSANSCTPMGMYSPVINATTSTALSLYPSTASSLDPTSQVFTKINLFQPGPAYTNPVQMLPLASSGCGDVRTIGVANSALSRPVLTSQSTTGSNCLTFQPMICKGPVSLSSINTTVGVCTMNPSITTPVSLQENERQNNASLNMEMENSWRQPEKGILKNKSEAGGLTVANLGAMIEIGPHRKHRRHGRDHSSRHRHHQNHRHSHRQRQGRTRRSRSRTSVSESNGVYGDNIERCESTNSLCSECSCGNKVDAATDKRSSYRYSKSGHCSRRNKSNTTDQDDNTRESFSSGSSKGSSFDSHASQSSSALSSCSSFSSSSSCSEFNEKNGHAEHAADLMLSSLSSSTTSTCSTALEVGPDGTTSRRFSNHTNDREIDSAKSVGRKTRHHHRSSSRHQRNDHKSLTSSEQDHRHRHPHHHHHHCRRRCNRKHHRHQRSSETELVTVPSTNNSNCGAGTPSAVSLNTEATTGSSGSGSFSTATNTCGGTSGLSGASSSSSGLVPPSRHQHRKHRRRVYRRRSSDDDGTSDSRSPSHAVPTILCNVGQQTDEISLLKASGAIAPNKLDHDEDGEWEEVECSESACEECQAAAKGLTIPASTSSVTHSTIPIQINQQSIVSIGQYPSNSLQTTESPMVIITSGGQPAIYPQTVLYNGDPNLSNPSITYQQQSTASSSLNSSKNSRLGTPAYIPNQYQIQQPVYRSTATGSPYPPPNAVIGLPPSNANVSNQAASSSSCSSSSAQLGRSIGANFNVVQPKVNCTGPTDNFDPYYQHPYEDVATDDYAEATNGARGDSMSRPQQYPAYSHPLPPSQQQYDFNRQQQHAAPNQHIYYQHGFSLSPQSTSPGNNAANGFPYRRGEGQCAAVEDDDDEEDDRLSLDDNIHSTDVANCEMFIGPSSHAMSGHSPLMSRYEVLVPRDSTGVDNQLAYTNRKSGNVCASAGGSSLQGLLSPNRLPTLRTTTSSTTDKTISGYLINEDDAGSEFSLSAYRRDDIRLPSQSMGIGSKNNCQPHAVQPYPVKIPSVGYGTGESGELDVRSNDGTCDESDTSSLPEAGCDLVQLAHQLDRSSRPNPLLLNDMTRKQSLNDTRRWMSPISTAQSRTEQQQPSPALRTGPSSTGILTYYNSEKT